MIDIHHLASLPALCRALFFQNSNDVQTTAASHVTRVFSVYRFHQHPWKLLKAWSSHTEVNPMYSEHRCDSMLHVRAHIRLCEELGAPG